MANPRIDDLRKRLEKEPGSRLFAQLAEELRKDGELAEAIRVGREGLQRQPNYPSAHMTLGRALFDSGQLTEARSEFEAVLRGAADNILASRLLGECLERLGDTQGALARFKSTLALVPGDRQVMSKIQALELSARALATAPASPAVSASAATLIMESPVAAPAAPAPQDWRPASPAPESSSADHAPAFAEGPADVYEPQPMPLAEVAEETFELEQAYEAAPTVVGLETGQAPGAFDTTLTDIDTGAAERETPLPVAGAHESLELERPYPSADIPAGSSEPPQAVAPVAPEATLGEPADASFDFDALPAEPAQAWHPSPPAGFKPEFEEAAREAPASGSGAADLEMSTVTLAELYFSQGVLEKAVEVYRQVLEREPGNERARARLTEIEALDRQLREEERRAAAEGIAARGPGAARRQAIERTIARLEALLAQLKRS